MTEKAVRLAGSILDRSRHVCAFFASKDEEYDLAKFGAGITVRDTGEGIDPAFLPYVFERFRQADGSTTREHSGLGIGLWIVRRLAELHGGSAEAASDGRGLGATFTLRLPVAGPS
jgi:signal transduction histidine kinase